MNEMRILSPTAILGYGFPETSFERGLKENPHVIGVDAGSTDPGPYYLGSGKCFVDRANVERDLSLIVSAAVRRKIPLIIGTAGGSGSRTHLQECLSILRQILRRNRLHPRIGIVHADIDRKRIGRELRRGRIEALPFVPRLTADKLAQTTNIVAQMGVEPLMAMLRRGIDIVLAGRCYDPAVFAALPVLKGFDPGLSIHLGKILECAAIAATPGSGRDCVLGILRPDHFLLKPLSRNRRFTVASVSAHSLYEKSDPVILPGPGGHLDLSQTRFTQKGRDCVEVRGSRFVKSPQYRIKLEGAMKVGYRTVSIAGMRDPIMISQIEPILEKIKEVTTRQYPRARLLFRTYGRNGVMGELEPRPIKPSHELGLVIEAIGKDQDEANAVCGYARSTLLHYGYPHRMSTAGNLAFPFSPSDFPAGEVYEFSLYHLMEVVDPVEPFAMEVVR